MSTYRYLTLLAVVVAALALPASAGAAPGSIIAQDHEVFGFIWTDASQSNPQDNSVTVNPGETVTFSYPTGTSVHNVAFNATGPQPASCAQTLPTPTAPGNPPLPAGPSRPRMGRELHVRQRGDVRVLLRRASGDDGHGGRGPGEPESDGDRVAEPDGRRGHRHVGLVLGHRHRSRR